MSRQSIVCLAACLVVVMSSMPARAACPAHASFVIENVGGAQPVQLCSCQTGQTTQYSYLNQALQSAINASPNGGFVLVKGWSYQMNGPVEFKDNVIVSGEVDATGVPNTQATIVAKDIRNTFRNFDGNNALTGQKKMVFKNFSIDAALLVEYIVSFKRSVDSIVENIKIRNPSGSAFGTSGNTNFLFKDCEAIAAVPPFAGGHGFSIAGAPEGIPDVGTTLFNCSAHGFNYNTDGGRICSEGVVVRSMAPSCPSNCVGNKDLRIIGGAYYDNCADIRILDATNPLLKDVRVHNNKRWGVDMYEVCGSCAQCPLAPSLPKEQVRVAIVGGEYYGNGGNGTGAMADRCQTDGQTAGILEGGLNLMGADSALTNVLIEANSPNNLVLDGKYFYVTSSRFGAHRLGVSLATTNHVWLIPYDGNPPLTAPLTGWFIRNCYSGAPTRFAGPAPTCTTCGGVTAWIVDWSPNPSDQPALCFPAPF
jgi:hypothetical protein